MKIATGIIGLMIGLLVLVQSCTATTAARFAGREELIQAGSVGVLAAFLTFVAGAFAFGLPFVAMVLFIIAGLLGFLASGAFTDMAIWGTVDMILALMAFFAWRSARKAKQAPEAGKVVGG